MPRTNRYAEAFKEQFNMVGLAGLAAASAAMLNPLPLLAGIVAEAVYLIFVPDTQWYERRLSRRYDAEVERRRQQLRDQILPKLRPSMQQRFQRLDETRKQIQSQPVEDQEWFREVVRKLDYLTEKFLQFALKDAEYREHLRSILQEVRGPRMQVTDFDLGPARAEDRSGKQKGKSGSEPPPVPRGIDATVREIQEHYDQEIANVKKETETEPDESTKAVLEKRLEVLQRRLEFAGKLARILTNLSHQIELLEDTFGLINDEIRARSPEQVLSDIDDVVFQTNNMTQVLEELAPYEQMLARLG